MTAYWWIAILVFALDRLTKHLAAGLNGPVVLIPGLLGLRYGTNTGVAYSLFSGRPVLLGLLSLVIIAGGAFLLRRFRLGRLTRTAAMLVLGGAVGNMLDRFLYGRVVDMIEFLFVPFPVFNIADSAIVTGVGLLMLSLFLKPSEWENRHGEQ